MGGDELAALSHDEARKEALFKKVVFERTAQWMQLAEDKLSGKGIRCYIMLGNDDPPEIAELIEACPVVENPESHCVRLDESHEMISLGFSNPTPWHTVRELEEPKLAERIATLMAMQDSNCVFNLHALPHGSSPTSPPADESLGPGGLGQAEIERRGDRRPLRLSAGNRFWTRTHTQSVHDEDRSNPASTRQLPEGSQSVVRARAAKLRRAGGGPCQTGAGRDGRRPEDRRDKADHGTTDEIRQCWR
jgi:hypothetical protein